MKYTSLQDIQCNAKTTVMTCSATAPEQTTAPNSLESKYVEYAQLGAAPLGLARPESLFFSPAIESASLTRSGSCTGVLPSHASWMSDIVLSRLLRRVLGLVIVVPRLAWRPWPRRKGEAAEIGDIGDMGEPGVAGAEVLIGVTVGVPAMTCSRASVTPFGETGATISSCGVAGCEEMRPLPSSDSGS